MADSFAIQENFDNDKIRLRIFSQVLTVILLTTVIPWSGLFLTMRDHQQSLVENLEKDFQSDLELIASGIDSWQAEIDTLARLVKRLVASVKIAFEVLKLSKPLEELVCRAMVSYQ